MTDYNKGKVRYKVIPTEIDISASGADHPSTPDGYEVDDISQYAGTSMRFKRTVYDGYTSAYDPRHLNAFSTSDPYVDIQSSTTNFR